LEGVTLIRAKRTLITLAIALAAPALAADDLTDAQRFLCAPSLATICSVDGECTSESPWNLDIPQFIQVDLEAQTLSTTEASGENRETPIKNLERGNGLIVLQGVENGRAFSFVIAEEDGMASVAVARDGLSVAVFGACTPIPVSD
jgi:hypothetical protein